MQSPASQSALSIIEIVSSVASHLSKTDLAEAALVSTTWRSAIEDTPEVRKIRDGPAVESVVKAHRFGRLFTLVGPHHPHHTHVVNNHTGRVIFSKHLKPHDMSDRDWHKRSEIYIDGSQDFDRWREMSYRYAASPPTQSLKLAASNIFGGPTDEVNCTVYVKTGVKIGHLLEASQKIWESDERYFANATDPILSTTAVSYLRRPYLIYEERICS
jgi:hypothetical protein